MKRYLSFRVFICILGIVILHFIYIVIHEFGHYIGCCIIGLNDVTIHLDFKRQIYYISHDELKYVKNKRFVLLMGILFTLSIGIIIYCISIRIKNNTLYWGTFISLTHELLYWFWSIENKYGDGWEFIMTYNNINSNLIMILIAVIIMFFTMITLYLWNKKFAVRI